MNTVPQGSAADVCKLAMIDIHRRAARELPLDSCRLLIQVRQSDANALRQQRRRCIASNTRKGPRLDLVP